MLNVTAYKGTNSASISGLAVSSLPWRPRSALATSQCQIHGIIFTGFQLDHVENPDSQADYPDSGHEFSYLRKIRIYNFLSKNSWNWREIVQFSTMTIVNKLSRTFSDSGFRTRILRLVLNCTIVHNRRQSTTIDHTLLVSGYILISSVVYCGSLHQFCEFLTKFYSFALLQIYILMILKVTLYNLMPSIWGPASLACSSISSVSSNSCSALFSQALS